MKKICFSLNRHFFAIYNENLRYVRLDQNLETGLFGLNNLETGMFGLYNLEKELINIFYAEEEEWFLI